MHYLCFAEGEFFKDYPDGNSKPILITLNLFGTRVTRYGELKMAPYPGYHHMIGMHVLGDVNVAVFMHYGEMSLSGGFLV